MSARDAITAFHTFPLNPNKVIELSDKFNNDHAYDGLTLTFYYRYQEQDRLSLMSKNFGSLDLWWDISLSDVNKAITELDYSFHKFIDEEGREESLSLKGVTKEDKNLIAKVLVPYVCSSGQDIKKVPLLIITWPDITKKIVEGAWLHEENK